MADEVRTTQYLFEFAEKGAGQVEQRFQQLISNLGTYEQQIAAKMQNIDKLLAGGGGGISGAQAAPASIAMPAIDTTSIQQAQQAIAQAQQMASQVAVTATPSLGGEKLLYEAEAYRDGSLAMTEYRKKLDDTVGTVERSRSTFNAYGREIENLNEKTWKAADGVKHLESRLTTDVTPGVPSQISSFTEMRDGKLRVEETTTALNDQANTIVRTKNAWDANDQHLGKYTTTVKTLADGSKETTVAIDGMSKAMAGGATYSEQMIRHLKWITQGILLWGAINVVSGAVSQWTTAQKELNQALAEFEMRTGATGPQLEAFQQGIMDASAATGVSPVKLAQVAPVAPDDATMRYAAELQRVAGGDMQNQMQWLIAAQRQFGMEGENTVQILNAMASGWRLTTLPMSEFITMLKNAAPLANDFNLSMQEMYSFMGSLQAATGAEGQQLELLARNMTRLYEPDVQQMFGKSSVQTTRVLPSGDVERRNLVAVLDEYNEKIKTGEITLQQFSALFGAVGRGQRQQAVAMMQGWDSFMSDMESSMSVPAMWSDMHGTAMDTASAKTDALKSAWERMLLSIGDTSGFQEFLENLTSTLDLANALISGNMESWSKTWTLDFDIDNILSALTRLPAMIPMALAAGMKNAGFSLGEMLGASIGDAISITVPQWLNDISAKLMNSPVIKFLMKAQEFEASNVLPTATRKAQGEWTDPRTAAREGSGQPYKVPDKEFEGTGQLPRFPSQAMIPQGVDFSAVVKSMDQWVAAFSALGPEFANWVNANMEMVMIYDENTRHLQMMNVFLPALQRAISENTQAQKTKDLQPGLRNVDLNLAEQGGMLTQWVQYYTQFLNKMGFPQESQPQLVMGQDDTFLRLWASNEALMLAIRALTEATEDQTDILSGMWNVPEGATMMVPIQSLFYSRKPGGDTPVGGLGPPPTTMPPQQTDWMKLPGAIDNMAVGNMTVTNLAGIDVTIPEGGTTALQETMIGAMAAFAASVRESLVVGKATASVGAKGGTGEWGSPDTVAAAIGGAIQINLDSIQATGGMEVSTPVLEAITPSMKATSMATDILTSVASLIAGSVNIMAGSITGLPTFDVTGMESVLQTMAGTLLLILSSLQSQQSAPYYPPGYDGGAPTGAPTDSAGGAPTPDQVRRFTGESSWWNFTNLSRMRSSL